MAREFAEKAKEAFLDDDFKRADEFYSKAIDLDPSNANLVADRAQANIKLGNFTEAVSDADKAIELNPTMSKAYLRKGTSCMKLEEYHTAKAALEMGASLAQDDSRFEKLIKECSFRITAEVIDSSKSMTPNLPSNPIPASRASQQTNSSTSFKPKYRHEYYQKPQEVVVTIFAKGIPAKNVAVDFGEQILTVAIDVPGEDAYCFQPRLFGKIIPKECRYEGLSTKVEIRLLKAELIHWPSLEYNSQATVLQQTYVSSVGSQRPAYPSSKSGGVDWDQMVADLNKQENEEKLGDDAELHKFFQDIYLSGDDDMRRAMSKSFVESNGTVLSTNWMDVRGKKVEGGAPQGMELKKW